MFVLSQYCTASSSERPGLATRTDTTRGSMITHGVELELTWSSRPCPSVKMHVFVGDVAPCAYNRRAHFGTLLIDHVIIYACLQSEYVISMHCDEVKESVFLLKRILTISVHGNQVTNRRGAYSDGCNTLATPLQHVLQHFVTHV